jgi:hypothetical protein
LPVNNRFQLTDEQRDAFSERLNGAVRNTRKPFSWVAEKLGTSRSSITNILQTPSEGMRFILVVQLCLLLDIDIYDLVDDLHLTPDIDDATWRKEHPNLAKIYEGREQTRKVRAVK